MKSAAFVSSLLASAALAQPHGHGHGHHRRHSHGHHAKRGLVTDWVTETVYETVTVIVDDSTTETIMPSSEHVQAQPSSSSVTTTTTALPGQFFENPKPSTAAPTTTSQPVAPPPVVQAPPPPPPPPPVTTTSTASQPTQTSGGGGGGGDGGSSGGAVQYAGDLTYYDLGLGACGWDDSGKDNSENIVALSHLLMGTQSNGNPYCGKSITVSYNGKTVKGVVRDKCMGCALDAIDCSKNMFLELFGTLDGGRHKVEWWLDN